MNLTHVSALRIYYSRATGPPSCRALPPPLRTPALLRAIEGQLRHQGRLQPAVLLRERAVFRGHRSRRCWTAGPRAKGEGFRRLERLGAVPGAQEPRPRDNERQRAQADRDDAALEGRPLR